MQSYYVQTFLAHKAAAYLSQELNTEVKIGGLRITYFLDIVLTDVSIKDKRDNYIINAEKIRIDIRSIGLDFKKIELDEVRINKVLINIVRYEGEKDWNYTFIEDYFSSSDTTKKEASAPMQLICRALRISDSELIMRDDNKNHTPGHMDLNNLNFEGFNLNTKNINIKADTISSNIISLSFKEQSSGLKLENLNGSLNIAPGEIKLSAFSLKTANTLLKGDLSFSGESFESFNYFIDSVNISAHLIESTVGFRDLSIITPELKGMNAGIGFSGKVNGKVNNFRGKGLEIKYGSKTRFSGDLTMVGLPYIEETFINANVKKLTTNAAELKSFSLPDKNGTPTYIVLPTELNKLGDISIQGQFTGFANNFVAKANFNSDLGSLRTDINLSRIKSREKFAYTGELQTTGFNIGAFSETQGLLGKVSLKLKLEGKGVSASDIKANLSGVIDSIEFRGYCYKNLILSGDVAEKKFNGDLNIKDPNIELDFSGLIDYSDSLPYFNFNAGIKNAYLSRLNLIKRDSVPLLSAHLDFRFRGDKIDNIQGDIQIDSLTYSEGRNKFSVQSINLSVAVDKQGNKELNLISDLAEINIKGRFEFADLPASIDKFLDDYIPSFTLYKHSDTAAKAIPDNNFTYKITLINTLPLCNLFVPGLEVSKYSEFYGFYNSLNSNLEINGKSASINYAGISFKNIKFTGVTESKAISLNVNLTELLFAGGIAVENINLSANAQNDSVLFGINWDNRKAKDRNSGQLNAFTSFRSKPLISAGFTNSSITLSDTTWYIKEGNSILIDSSSLKLTGIAFEHGKQQITANGVISHDINDRLKIGFTGFNISNFDSIFAHIGFDADGIMDGEVELVDVYKAVNFYTDIKINNFAFNEDKLGTVALRSTWDAFRKGIKIEADIIYRGNIGENIPLAVKGYYFPSAADNNFDLDIDITNFKLNSLEGYLAGIISNLRGKASGKLRLEGKTSEPILTGYLNLYHVGIHVDYLGTDYSLMGKIFAAPGVFSFDSLIVYDNNNNEFRGNKAECSGKIFHNHFRDISFDVNIKPERFTVLNTNATQNSLYYGQAIATGTASIKGTPEKIFMDISAKTERGTRLVLPFSGTSEVSENNFIKFIKNDSLSRQAEANETLSESGIELRFNLDITPDAEMKIEFDPKIGDIITARGKGNMLMNISTNGDFTMFGELMITEGDYLFTFENVINKQFKVASGGSIAWRGDPYEASSNLKAVYDKPRAPLYDLVMHIDSSGKYRQKIPVSCILGLSGNLFNPAISFGIELPGADASTKDIFYAVLDTTDEQEMLRQVFSLMVLNRFLPKQNSYENPLGAGVGNTSFELLSSQLSNWLSQISSSFDVGFNYRPGDALSSDQVEVALKTQFMQDRLVIDGNLGMAGSNHNANSQASNIVGDVNVEYKLTDDGRFRVKAFSKANTAELLENHAPYTQGVGIFYRREFDNFYDIFRIKRRIVE